MLVIRSKCMLEKQAEGLQRSTGTLPVHGCASDWPCLWYKAGFSAASAVEAADGSSCRGCGLPRSPPEELSSPLPVLKSRPTRGLTLPNQWRWKISAIAAFCGCPSFPFPPLRSSSAFFSGLRLSVTRSSFLVLLFLLLFRNYVEGAEGWGRVVWGRERAWEWGGGKKRVAKKLCSFQPGALWKIWHPLLICSSKNPSGEGMLKEKKKSIHVQGKR